MVNRNFFMYNVLLVWVDKKFYSKKGILKTAGYV